MKLSNVMDISKINFIKGNYMIDGKLQLKNGFIKNNPFSKRIGNCDAAKWILDNKQKAKGKIREIMKEQSLGTHEVDECFSFAVYYFLEKDDREFNPDYFGETGSKTYSIEIYCLFKLKLIVYEYRNEMRKRMKNTVYLVDTDKDDVDNLPRGCISYNVLKREENNEGDELNFNDIIEFEDLQDILDYELPRFDEDFKTVGLLNFRLREYVYFTFLQQEEMSFDIAGNKLEEKTMEKVAENLGLSVSALMKINKLIKNLMKTRSDLFGNLPELIGRLVQGKINGWRPILTDIK